MAIMDRLFWETYNMTSARQADREVHIKCVGPFCGSKNRALGDPAAYQLTSDGVAVLTLREIGVRALLSWEVGCCH